MGYIGTKPQTATTLADNIVTADKIASGAVTATKLATDSVTADKLATDSVTASKIAADAVNSSEIASGAITSSKLASGVGGKVLQVVQAVQTSAFSMGTSDWTDISGVTANITPSSTSSRILVSCFFGSVTAGANGIVLRIVRNGTAVGIGDSSGSRDRVTVRGMREGDTNHTRWQPSFQYVDSTSTTSAITYKVQIKTEGNGTAWINRSQTDTDISNAYGGRGIASIILTEIAA
jgi:hypothetical protein